MLITPSFQENIFTVIAQTKLYIVSLYKKLSHFIWVQRIDALVFSTELCNGVIG